MLYATNVALSIGQITDSVRIKMEGEEQFHFTETRNQSWEEKLLPNKDIIKKNRHICPSALTLLLLFLGLRTCPSLKSLEF